MASISATRHHWLSGSESSGLETVNHPSVLAPSTSGVATMVADAMRCVNARISSGNRSSSLL